MQQEDPTYDRHQEEPRLAQVPVRMSAQDERRWSIVARLKYPAVLNNGHRRTSRGPHHLAGLQG
jgi:hypothetical protein